MNLIFSNSGVCSRVGEKSESMSVSLMRNIFETALWDYANVLPIHFVEVPDNTGSMLETGEYNPSGWADIRIGLVTPERLQKMCASYQADWGLFTGRDCITLFRREKSIAVIWRQYWGHSFDEYVAEAVFVEQNGRIFVDHAMVF